MITMELHEAQLFRMLSGLFGEDRVIFQMSALAVCGGSLPPSSLEPAEAEELETWARQKRCLFTIVNQDDLPKLVVDFYTAFSEAVDVNELEDNQRLEPLFEASGIHFVLMTKQELSEMLDPSSSLTLVSLLQDRCGVPKE